MVYKFPLKIIYPDKNEPDAKIEKISCEILEIEESLSIDVNNNDLIFREGKLEIRKFRKKEEIRKQRRMIKPDYLAEQIVKDKQGKINEKVVYDNEIKKLMKQKAEPQIKIMEEFFLNKKENEGFDILSFEKDSEGNFIEKYIEVKSTKGNEGTPIDITDYELEFAKNHIDHYYLYRIVNCNSKERYVKIVSGRELVESYQFVPTVYKIYSN